MSERSGSGSRRETSDLFALVERLPFVGSVARELSQLRALLVERRAPRILAIGARGAGKSALANALLRADVLPALPRPEATAGEASPPSDAPATDIRASGHDEVGGEGPTMPAGGTLVQGAWIRASARSRQIAWLELPAAEQPLERDTERLLRNALDEHAPDVILLVLHAERVEDELPGVVATLRRVLDALGVRAEGVRVLSVVTAADTLARPEAFATPPYPTDAMARIERATLLAKTHLDGAKVGPTPHARAVPCACTADAARRWNLEEVADAIFARLPEETHVEAVRALPVGIAHTRDVARAIVGHCAAMAVTVGLAPIPFSDSFVLLPVQALMVTAVAYVAGQPWDRRAALEWVGSLGVMGGAAFGLRFGAQQLVKLVPGAGTLVSASVAGAGTLALGRSAIAYFVDGRGRRADA
jgi:uncharacterized protein (DUF697 family)/predicted GTPase